MKPITDWEAKLCQVALNGIDTKSNKAMDILRKQNDTWHFCPEWDFLPISSQTPEYEVCLCGLSEKDAEIKNNLFLKRVAKEKNNLFTS